MGPIMIELSDLEASLLIRAGSLVRLDDAEFTSEEQAKLRQVVGRLDRLRKDESDSGIRADCGDSGSAG